MNKRVAIFRVSQNRDHVCFRLAECDFIYFGGNKELTFEMVQPQTSVYLSKPRPSAFTIILYYCCHSHGWCHPWRQRPEVLRQCYTLSMGSSFESVATKRQLQLRLVSKVERDGRVRPRSRGTEVRSPLSHCLQCWQVAADPSSWRSRKPVDGSSVKKSSCQTRVLLWSWHNVKNTLFNE